MNKIKPKRLILIFLILCLLLVGTIFIFPKVSEFIFKQQELKSLNTKGGAEISIQVVMNGIPSQDRSKVFAESKDILFKRIRLFGFYPFLQSTSDYKIFIKVANVGNLDTLANLISSTAELTFKEKETTTNNDSNLNFTKVTNLNGGDIELAQAVLDSKTGLPYITIKFNSNGVKKLEELTSRNIGKPIGIFIDNSLITAPLVQEPIRDGNVMIAGKFTSDEAKQLAIAINSGALPAPIKVLEKHSIKK